MIKPKQKFLIAQAVNPLLIPKQGRLYHFMIMNSNNKLKQLVKDSLLKPLLSLAELVANW